MTNFGITLFTGTMIIVLNFLVDMLAVVIARISRSPRVGRRMFGGVAARTT